MPEVRSLALAVTCMLELYHPLPPIVPFTFRLTEGVTVSTEMVVEEVETFPALSSTCTSTAYTPSLRVVEAVHAPPLTDNKTLDNPDVESEPMAVTVVEETYQVFVPFEPMTSRPTFGDIVSTLAERVPISELSPYEDNAQKVRSLLPSFKGTSQAEPEQANACPFNEPSTARML